MKNLSEYIEYIREQAKKIQRYHTDGTNFELKLEKLFRAKNISIEEKKKILARRLPNKNVWVRECYAGQKSLGVIEKDYSVEKTKVITT